MRLCMMCCCLIAFLSPQESFAQNDGGFVSLFDGKTLKNWDGNPKFWSVQDGAITGQTTTDNPTSGNTFLIYRGGELANFELRFQYKIIGGNSMLT